MPAGKIFSREGVGDFMVGRVCCVLCLVISIKSILVSEREREGPLRDNEPY